jgi:hypothetical protein
MSFPGSPDFTLAADDGAWWLIASTDASGNQQTILCTTNGRAFVDQMQAYLGVTMDGKWGANTSSALLAQARTFGAPQAALTALQAEAANQQCGLGTISTAIWLLHQSFPIGDATQGIAFTQIGWTPGTAIVFPQWNTAAPLGPGGEISPTCTITVPAAVTPVPSADQGATQTPASAPAPVVQTAAQDLGVTTLIPQGTPTGTITQSGSSIPWPVVIGGVLVVGVVGWVAWSSTRTKQPAQRQRVRS